MSIKYTERLAEAEIEASVGSVGDSDDSALAETINGRLLEPIGNIAPAEAEERYYAMLDDTPMAT